MSDEAIKQTEHYLELFEKTIAKHKQMVGEELALEQARQAGLGVSPDGHIVSCVGHPVLVLLRLIKVLTVNSQMATLAECMPLIDEMEQLSAHLGPVDESLNQN